MRQDGLATFNLIPEDAANLSRAKRRSVAGFCVRFGYYQEALGILRHMIQENPGGIECRRWMVNALLGSGDIEAADQLSVGLLVDFPDNRQAIIARAAVLFSRGEMREGFDLMRRFMNDPRESHSYWAHLGAGMQRKGWWTDARAALDQALSIYQARLKDSDSEKTYAPVYLWLALAMQEEHEGIASGPGAAELERLRAEDEQKVKDILARPDPKTTSRPEKSQRSPERLREEIREMMADEASQGLALPSVPTDCAPSPELEAHLRSLFGFERFRPGQQQVIESVLAGRSVLSVMPTGGGKSLCYQLPAMLLGGLTLVISPLIALMKDQVDGLPASVQQQATLINSSLEGDEIDRRMKEIRAGRYKLVYAAPERLRQRPFLHALRKRGLSLVVVDEAHCVSLWGHDFRPDYLFIGEALKYLGHPTVLAMTATATPRMRIDIANHFGRQLHLVNTGTHRPNLFLESVVVRSDDQKMHELVRLCREIDGPGIVYTRSRRKAEELAMVLKRERVRAVHYHAGMDTEERTRAQDEFMDGRWRVICATVAFGMGIDKSDVRFVVHYSLPQSLEDYYQEAGRAGRDGFPARCILMCTPADKALTTRWMHAERIDLDVPKRCYQVIRDLTREDTFAAIPCDDFERELEQDETRVRVAVSMLEDVGLVKRHLDVPTTATVTLIERADSRDDAEFAEFVSGARLRPGQRVPFETLELCARTGISPCDIEDRLLEWRDRGWLYYHGSGRVMLLERPCAPRDARQMLEERLREYAAMQDLRVEEMFDYAESRRCKHGAIAEHFGEEPIEKCSSCDSCSGQKQPEQPARRAADNTVSDDEKTRRILETVAMIPGKVGFVGLVRVLKGSFLSGIRRDRCKNFGILADEPKATVERRVSELLEQGLLVRDESEYRLIWPGRDGGE